MLQYVDRRCHGKWSHDRVFLNTFVKLQGSKFCEGSEVYTHWSIVPPYAIWYCVCGNYTSIIASHYHDLFHCWSLALQFLRPQWTFSLPNLILRFQFRFEVTHPGFLNSNYSLQKCNSFLFVTSQMFLTQFHMSSFCVGNSMCGTHLATTSFFIRYSVKMWCIIVFSILDAPFISYTIVRLFLSSYVDTIPIEMLSIVVEGRLVPASSSIGLPPVLPPLKNFLEISRDFTFFQDSFKITRYS